MDQDTNRLLRERLRRLMEENILLEQRLMELGQLESSRLLGTGNVADGSQLRQHQLSLDSDFGRRPPTSVHSQLEMLQRSDPIYNSRIRDIPLSAIERQRHEVLLRELTATGRPPRPRGFEIPDSIPRHQHSLEEGLQQALERSARQDELQRAASLLPQRFASRESLLQSLLPAAGEQALLRNSPYAAAASMPSEASSSELPQSPHAVNLLSKTPYDRSKTEDGAVLVALDADGDFLTKYQVVLRQCLEFFTAQAKDVETSVQGRKHKVQVGQIGLRCRFCCHLPIYQRGRGSVHFVKNIRKIYQAAQNMSTTHFISSCSCIPKDLRARLAALRGIREMGKVGNVYWVDSCKDLGIVEHNGALWWEKDEGKFWSKDDVSAPSATDAATTSVDGSDKEDSTNEEMDNKVAGTKSDTLDGN